MNVLDYGAFPGTVKRCTTAFDQDMLSVCDKVLNVAPGTSLKSFMNILRYNGKREGRGQGVPVDSFSRAYHEWCKAHYEVTYTKDHRNGFDCPVCKGDQHSCMVDGNRKLFRWDKEYEEYLSCYYDELEALFYKDKEVQDFMDKVDRAFGTDRKPDHKCGTTAFKAARDSTSALKHQCETGLVMCCCRHQFAQKAVNMIKSGERYGYALYLDIHFMRKHKVGRMWEDVICKYWPWRANALDLIHEAPGKLLCALNVMHGKLHSWPCQVLWGGRWQEGAAGGAGEDMEQLFSYLSRLNTTTKNMGATRRAERITEACLYWNENKRIGLPKSLRKRSLEIVRKVKEAFQEFKAILLSLSGKEYDDRTYNEFIEPMIREVKEAAHDQLHASQTGKKEAAYFALHTEVKAARGLASYFDVEEFNNTLLCSEEMQAMHNKIRLIVANLAANEVILREMEVTLLGRVEGDALNSRDDLLKVSRKALAKKVSGVTRGRWC
eukprot:jgi/Mesen1/9233/ME000595S08637